MNRGENVREKPIRAKKAERPRDLHADLARTTRRIFGLNRTSDAVQRASACHRAAQLHYELGRKQPYAERRRHQERSLALLREALSLTDPSCRYHRAKLMQDCAYLYQNLDRNPDDLFEACDLLVNAASIFLQIGNAAKARKIANEASELADEHGINLILPRIPPPLKHRRR